MRRKSKFWSRRAFTVAAICGVLLAAHRLPAACHAAPPRTTYWEGDHLEALRAAGLEGDTLYEELADRLRENARLARKRGPYSVVYKDVEPPSGDKHDYLSYSRYWWPNPDTDNGLPYIRRDGKTNRKLLAKGDRVPIGMLYDDVETLALAGYLLHDDAAAEHAATLVRAWFLDPATRMNPHLRYAQAVPGRSAGRGTGIIDTRHFIRVLDAVALMKQSGAWTDDDQAALTAWMRQYLDWLLHDPMGEDERRAENNHGTWYDAQAAAIAMFIGEHQIARDIVEKAKERRIARCIEPDGRQLEEITRTKSLHYHVFNLSAMAVLARIGEHLDVDLWNYESEDGSSIRGGLAFVVPYLVNGKEWPHPQIEPMRVSPSDSGLFFLASSRYHKPRYLRAIQNELRDPERCHYAPLLFDAD